MFLKLNLFFISKTDVVWRFYFDRFFLVIQIVCVSEILNNNSLMDKAKEEKWPFLKVYLHDTTATVTMLLMRTLSDIHWAHSDWHCNTTLLRPMNPISQSQSLSYRVNGLKATHRFQFCFLTSARCGVMERNERFTFLVNKRWNKEDTLCRIDNNSHLETLKAYSQVLKIPILYIALYLAFDAAPVSTLQFSLVLYLDHRDTLFCVILWGGATSSQISSSHME